MNERQIASINEFSKYLRSMQFTLLATCIAFLAILLSERKSTIALADKQINDIYSYTLENSWNSNGIQEFLNSNSNDLTLSSGAIQFINGTSEIYIFDSGKNRLAKFEFTFQSKYFKDFGNSNAINFDGNIRRPETLHEFKVFFNAISNPIGVYSLSGIKSPIKHIEGHEQNNPADQGETESEIRFEEISIVPKSIYKGSEHSNINSFDANFEDGGQLKLRWVDGYSDNMGNTYEDYIYYIIPFKVNEERYRPLDFILACSSFQGAERWFYSSFEDQFKALHEVTKDWDDISIGAAKKIINSENTRTGDTFQVLGIQLPSQGILSWGIFIILGIQLYFYLHLREFLNRYKSVSVESVGVTVPWLILYNGKFPMYVYFGTVILIPLISAITVLIINLSIYPISEVLHYLHVVVAGVGILIVSVFLWIEQRKINDLSIR
ncbi:MAG: hypothetical protein N4A74_26110 [Carboxylicivirga sp.]|jgi:hypothetical protein|nr:hypothetical protein [Carboxylicivirga sp.]